MYGQDITSGCRSRAPQGQSVGNNVGELKPKMLKLLGIFAGGDKTGMAKRLFDEFLSNRIGTVGYFVLDRKPDFPNDGGAFCQTKNFRKSPIEANPGG